MEGGIKKKKEKKNFLMKMHEINNDERGEIEANAVTRKKKRRRKVVKLFLLSLKC